MELKTLETLIRCVPFWRVEEKLVDGTMLKIVCEGYTIVCKMGLFAACDDLVAPCLVKGEQFFDKG